MSFLSLQSGSTAVESGNSPKTFTNNVVVGSQAIFQLNSNTDLEFRNVTIESSGTMMYTQSRNITADSMSVAGTLQFGADNSLFH